jgi:hypothetical protein
MENQTKKGQVWLHDPVVLNHIITEFDLQDYGTNAAEGILCETSETLFTSIFDYVMKGTYQFMIDKDGGHFVKPYGKSTWETT